MKSLVLICIITCFFITCFSQDKAPVNISVKIGLGSNISTQHFFTNETSLNISGTPFMDIGLSTNLLNRGNKSLFIGLQMQAVDYYPTVNEKSNVGFVSLLAGKTKRFDLSQQVYMKYTNGLSVNSLIEVTSSNINHNTYSGNPFKNINVGAFSNLQVLFAGGRRKNRNIDYGIGIDLAYKGLQLFRDGRYPSYMINNYFFQYGLNLSMNYIF